MARLLVFKEVAADKIWHRDRAFAGARNSQLAFLQEKLGLPCRSNY